MYVFKRRHDTIHLPWNRLFDTITALLLHQGVGLLAGEQRDAGSSRSSRPVASGPLPEEGEMDEWMDDVWFSERYAKRVAERVAAATPGADAYCVAALLHALSDADAEGSVPWPAWGTLWGAGGAKWPRLPHAGEIPVIAALIAAA